LAILKVTTYPVRNTNIPTTFSWISYDYWVWKKKNPTKWPL